MSGGEPQAHPEDGESMFGVIASLREELLTLDDSEILEAPSALLSHAVSQLAPSLNPSAAAAVDELMSVDEPISTDLRSRLLGPVDEILTRYRVRAGLLETMLKARRQAVGMTQADLAQTVGIDENVVRRLEDGELRLEDVEGEDETIARWIHALEQDDGQAVEALRRSVMTTAREYGGHPAEHAEEFVKKVAVQLEALRQQDAAE
jgi:transcriptional regulator with XRE-family HTH domain